MDEEVREKWTVVFGVGAVFGEGRQKAGSLSSAPLSAAGHLLAAERGDGRGVRQQGTLFRCEGEGGMLVRAFLHTPKRAQRVDQRGGGP